MNGDFSKEHIKDGQQVHEKGNESINEIRYYLIPDKMTIMKQHKTKQKTTSVGNVVEKLKSITLLL